MSQNASPGVADHRHAEREWLVHLALPLAVAVLAALLVTALTPIGENVRELVFPTRASVSGSVVLDAAPVVGARVELEGSDEGTTTNASGEFGLRDVGRGTHRLRVEAAGALPYERDVVVPGGSAGVPMEPIALQPMFRLGYSASLAPDGSGGQRLTYDVAAWIQGSPDDLDRIRSVSYVLPAPLTQEPVTGGSIEQAFCYRELGSVSFDDLVVFGGGSPVAARVDVGDEAPLVLTWGGQTGSRPPLCRTVEVDGASDGGSGGGSGGGSDGGSGSGQRPSSVLVPPVVGLRLADAHLLITGARLTVAEVGERESDEPAGVVLEAAPGPGQRVDEGTAIRLVVSSGSERVSVPEVVDVDVERAGADLVAVGLLVAEKYVVDAARPLHTVVEVSPAAGSRVDVGSTITLTVVNEQVPVPDVQTRSFAEAEEKLVGSGFRVVRVDEVTEDRSVRGLVVGQSPLPEEGPAWRRTVVTVTVAVGP